VDDLDLLRAASLAPALNHVNHLMQLFVRVTPTADSPLCSAELSCVALTSFRQFRGSKLSCTWPADYGPEKTRSATAAKRDSQPLGLEGRLSMGPNGSGITMPA
jgi:hypothetical protein